MRDERVKELLRQALLKDQLWDTVDQTESQFLEVGHPYAHLVLNDASAYERVLEVVKALAGSNAKDLEWVVRSKWEMVSVEFNGPYYDSAGNLYTSSDIGVKLKSGPRTHRLRVAVSYMASQALQEITGAEDKDYERHKRDMTDAVTKYIEILLSGKGRDNSWDPLWLQGDLELNADGIRWLHSQIARRA
jgi:hypothetical protein